MMKRLLFSATGVILTFIWIIYTAPPLKSETERPSEGRIKTIVKSGSKTYQHLAATIEDETSSKKIDKPSDQSLLKTLEITGYRKFIPHTY